MGSADTQEQQQQPQHQQHQQQQQGEEVLLPVLEDGSLSQEALRRLEKSWQLVPVDNLSDREGEGGQQQQQQQQHAGGPPAPANHQQQVIPEPSPLPPPSGALHPELQGLDDPGSNEEAVSSTVSHLLQVGTWTGTFRAP
jgi:hypothetical protein